MIYTFLANGFEEIEAVTPIDLLRRAGLKVTTVGIGEKDGLVEGAHGIKIKPDTDSVDYCDLEMIILPGGNPGYINLENSPLVKEAVKHCYQNGIYIAAICAAPSILGRMGILKGKNATVYPGMEEELLGAHFKTDPVVVDDKIITSRGAGTAIDFSGVLISLLAGEEKAKEVLSSIVYKQ